MKKLLKPALVLTLILSVAAIVLSLINRLTLPKIEEYELSVLQAALKDISCGYEIGNKTDVTDDKYVTYYYPLSENQKTVGYLMGIKTNGYGGEMNLVASFYSDGSVMKVKLVSDSETPGVGKRAENETYMDLFIGTGSPDKPVPLTKSDLNSVDSAVVSGATMTFTGIVKALSYGSSFVLQLRGIK